MHLVRNIWNFEVQLQAQLIISLLQVYIPYSATAKCKVILELYHNFDMETRRPDQEEARVVKIVKEDLSLDDSIKPEWYFDLHDPWMPGDPDYP